MIRTDRRAAAVLNNGRGVTQSFRVQLRSPCRRRAVLNGVDVLDVLGVLDFLHVFTVPVTPIPVRLPFKFSASSLQLLKNHGRLARCFC